ncbi:MAG: bifunctional riboflavin kinase/FAD synthetase [Xanthomonadales bacterium]
MRVIRNRPEWTGGSFARRATAVAIGNFDGVHLGHQALIQKSRELAVSGLDSAVMTFEPLPAAFFRPQAAPARLTTVYRKLDLLRCAGVDLTWMVRFDGRFAGLSADEFVRDVLTERLRARYVVVGEDFHFGRQQQGDVALLRRMQSECGFEVVTVPAVTRDGERISSSGIRARLAEADFAGAERFLGRPFRMEGHVVRGQQLGRRLGYPTANLRIRAEPSPLHGVLAVYARIAGGAWLPAVANLGRRPVVGGRNALLEVHFFDFDADIYGQRLDVQFVAKLRDEQDFDGLDALVEKMKGDERDARMILAETEPPARRGGGPIR